MKKSEAIQALRVEVQSIKSQQDVDNGELAEMLLNQIEHFLGMLPPMTSGLRYKDQQYAAVAKEHYFIWESEDENR